MDEAGARSKVRIFGETYVIRSAQADEEHIRRVAEAVDARMRELAGRYPGLNVTRLAVLAALNLADELLRLREQHRVLMTAFERRLAAIEGGGEAPGLSGAASEDRARPASGDGP
ncbi:MAG: cell division protein ZapA [Thermaerobacter sp.]|nr:cell division protein ZapA [Bacillota bacterium]REJ32699.1 MAG: cell division protein ZapA [Bacillota bacterium]